MRVSTMNTRKAAYYGLLAAYVVFMVAMVLRSQRTDRQLAAIDRRTKHLRDAAVSGGVRP